MTTKILAINEAAILSRYKDLHLRGGQLYGRHLEFDSIDRIDTDDAFSLVSPEELFPAFAIKIEEEVTKQIAMAMDRIMKELEGKNGNVQEKVGSGEGDQAGVVSSPYGKGGSKKVRS